ncbi:unnamed protein product [Leptosia nina]|uniref:Kazal-like domain-containing protein n=1 Tax=Leptosia nina TaxID=320188 RepID=A0AAV1JX22_9NEOP
MINILIFLQCSLGSGIFAALDDIFDSGVDLSRYGGGRRQRVTNPPPHKLKHPRHNQHKGEKSEPNYGYEPYWEGYDNLLKKKKKVTGSNVACGEECHEMYLEYGPVCGRGKNYMHKTFQNYCQLLNQDCSGREKWMIAYRGPCEKVTHKPYPTRQRDFIKHAKMYLTDFEKNNPVTEKLRFIRTTRPGRKRKSPPPPMQDP